MNKRAYSLDETLRRLAAGEVVPVDADDFAGWSAAFTLVDTVRSAMGGDKQLLRWTPPGARKLGWLLVEEPDPGLLAVRPLKTEKEARALIAERLAAYERMWDG
ncbi:MAG TPA: hypothetical protein PLQ13_08175 [Candidatus Krumholzibacteria bacterium]|nr:hypothetical protein [Candidatus Krumholzibacteria bacterium]